MFGPLAQWLELPAHNRLVAGSSPAGSTKCMIRVVIDEDKLSEK